MSVKPTESEETPRCSFCHKSKDDVAYLVASPPDYPRAYICDECVEFCHSILGDSRSEPQTDQLPKHNMRRLPSHITKCPKCGEAFGEKPLSTS